MYSLVLPTSNVPTTPPEQAPGTFMPIPSWIAGLLSFAPAKRKLRAWLIPVNSERFRVLEAYLDQDVDVHAFHVSIRGERAWPVGEPYPKKNIYGTDEVWKWLLSWGLPQPLN